MKSKIDLEVGINWYTNKSNLN